MLNASINERIIVKKSVERPIIAAKVAAIVALSFNVLIAPSFYM